MKKKSFSKSNIINQIYYRFNINKNYEKINLPYSITVFR